MKLLFGDPLPNTYYLKTTGVPIGSMIQSGWAGLSTPGWGHLAGNFSYSVALFLLCAVWLGRASQLARLLACVVLAAVLYFIRVGGDWFTEHFSRFLVPVVPLYVAIIVAGTWSLLSHALFSRPGVVPFCVWLVVPVLVICMNRPGSFGEWFLSSHPPMQKADNIRAVDYARHLCRFTRPDTLIGVCWAGVLPYHCDRPMLDLLGKTDAHIAKGPAVPASSYWPGHAKRDWDYVFRQRKPDILLAEMPEMVARPDYLADYCIPWNRLWLAVRRTSLSKITFPGIACSSPQQKQPAPRSSSSSATTQAASVGK